MHRDCAWRASGKLASFDIGNTEWVDVNPFVALSWRQTRLASFALFMLISELPRLPGCGLADRGLHVESMKIGFV